jgi:hypothetical protein
MEPLRDRVGAIPSDAEVLDHGFDFRPAWWLHRPQEPSWADFLTTLPAARKQRRGADWRHITRGDLLRSPETGPRPDGALLLGGYVWGTGDLGFRVGRRAQVFTDARTTAGDVTARLAAAVEVMRNHGPSAGYATLLRYQDNWLRHLGPSFFTKFLYFADADGSTGGVGRALILDQFVAIGLNYLEGWNLDETGPWPVSVYERWLDYAHEAAAEPDGPGSGAARADAIEMAVFLLGRRVDTARRGRVAR